MDRTTRRLQLGLANGFAATALGLAATLVAVPFLVVTSDRPAAGTISRGEGGVAAGTTLAVDHPASLLVLAVPSALVLAAWIGLRGGAAGRRGGFLAAWGAILLLGLVTLGALVAGSPTVVLGLVLLPATLLLGTAAALTSPR
jgi:hypothetical protein